MDFFEVIKNLAFDITKNVEKTVNETLSDNSVLQSIKNVINSSVTFKEPIPNFPIIELVAKKNEGNELTNEQNIEGKLTIDDYEKKYIPISLDKKIKSMPDSEKAYLYYYLGHSIYNATNPIFVKRENIDISLKLLYKALSINSNIDIAYEIFTICNMHDFWSSKEKSVDIGELCIKLSNNIDIKNKFTYIYYLMGKYYNLEENDYEKALDCLKKSISYSKAKEEDKLYIYRDLAYVYRSLGDYQNSLKTCCYIESIDKYYNDIPKLKTEMENYVKNNITKKEVDRKNFLSDMKYYFKKSVGVYPDEVIEEGYNHFLKGKQLSRDKKPEEAIKEFEEAIKILPTETAYIQEYISGQAINIMEKNNDESRLLKSLQSRLKIALETGNSKDLARVYNEFGIAYSNQKQYDKAIEHYNKAIEVSHDPAYYANLAHCYSTINNYDEAISIYNTIIKDFPNYADFYNAEFEITRLKNIKLGIISKNESTDSKAIKHYRNANQLFNNGNIEEAIKEYDASTKVDKNFIKALIRELISKNIYQLHFSDESEIATKALNLCLENENYNYLPFVFTVLGDTVAYGDWEKDTEAAIYYEIATFFLNMLPEKERFAAPYYKLARSKELNKSYKEALKLYEQTQKIDSTYDLDDDLKRIKMIIDNPSLYKEQSIRLATRVKECQDYKNNNLLNQCIEALKLIPNHAEILYLISNTAEKLNKPYLYKWATLECLRITLNEYDKKGHFNDLIFSLGKISKYEKKYSEARYYLGLIVNDDEFDNRELYYKALDEYNSCK